MKRKGAHTKKRTQRKVEGERTRRVSIHERRVLTGTGEVHNERTIGRPQDGRPLEGLRPTRLSGLGLLTPIEDVMTPCVVCVRADVDVESIAALMERQRISAVPVVDERGRPIGIVSKTDLLRELQQGHLVTDEAVRLRRDDVVYDLGSGFHVDSLGGLTAEDVMTKVVVWLPPDAPVAAAAGIMAAERIHRAVVLSDDRRVIGIVSALDLLAWIAGEAGLGEMRRPAEPAPSEELRP